MAIDKKYIGKTYPETTYVIGREKAKEYIRAIGDSNSLYASGDVAHPMFIVVYARDSMFQLLEDKEIGIDMNRLVHGEQEFTFHNDVLENDAITTISEIKEIYDKSGNDFVVLHTRSVNQDKKLVSEGTWTFVIRG